MSDILVFTMEKVGSSSVIYNLKQNGHKVDRAYEGNIHDMAFLKDYDAVYTLVRDPVARNLSYYFELYGEHAQEAESFESIREDFLDSIHHQYPLDWFDKVFYPFTYLDVYKYPFPSSGILFLGKVCILRTDQLQMEHRAKTAETRTYGETYQKFLDWVKLPENYLDEMYKSKFVQHFFQSKEIDQLYERWIE